MSPENFCYWLQGFVEIAKRPPTPEEWVQIVNHLQTVFHKVTPTASTTITYPWTLLDDGVRLC